MSERLLIVTPVRDEAGTIERVAAAVEAQTRPPDLWLVVDDGSRDETPRLLRALAAELPFMRVAGVDDDVADSAAGLERGSEARAFNAGLRLAGWHGYDYVGKLDGDIELPPDYFERLLEALRHDPRLGIAGGVFGERGRRGWRTVREPSTHVAGALKLYRRDCLLEIGGIDERLGWDTADELRARMRGWETRALASLQARHHRRWGSAGGRLRGCRRYGACAHAIGEPAWWVVLRALKVSRARPPIASGLAFLAGYAAARVRRAPRVEDDVARFARRELRARLRGAATRKLAVPQGVLRSWRSGY